MKTLRMIGMAVIAFLIGAGCLSCSKDENSDGNRKLTKFVTVTDSGNEVGWTFTYDSNGKLNRAQFNDEWNGQTHTQTYQFSWNGDVVDVRQTDGSDDAKYTFTIENGLIRSARSTRNSYTENFTYTYFADRLERIDIKQGEATNYTTAAWDGDKLTRMSYSYSGSSAPDETLAITCEKSCSKGYCPLIAEMIGDTTPYIYLYMAHPELIGAKTTQLPTSVARSYHGNNESYNVNYEFDNNGYISKIVRNGVALTLKWE